MLTNKFVNIITLVLFVVVVALVATIGVLVWKRYKRK